MKTNDEIINFVKPYTICDVRRTNATIESVRGAIEKKISGSLVECGVYKGGQIMAMIEVLKAYGVERPIYLYDTFEGMSKPEECDISTHFGGCNALKEYETTKPTDESHFWVRCTLDNVKANVAKTGYNPDLIHYVKGKVEDTIPNTIPDQIAVLRLDTDWYSSTKHELEHLYPLLNSGGYLMLDDYGHWQGARKAADEYIITHPEIKFIPIDYTGVIAVKP